MTIANGKYKAKATGQAVLGESAKKKTPFIEFYLAVLNEGQDRGTEIRFTGYFGPESSERTIESLQTCGWKGDDLGEFADGGLHGLDANEVEIVVEHEEWTDEKSGQTRTTPRVRWINKPGGHLNVDNAMSKEAAASFGERMKGLVLKAKEKAPVKGNGTDFDYGANAQDAPKAAAGVARKAW